jgi:hypothetical protein
MRVAKPNELKTHAYPVLTAAISEDELAEWFPVSFHEIADPKEAAEPSKAALIKLDAGEYFVLFYGQLSNQLMVRIPTSTNAANFMDAFLREVPLPTARIVWRRQDATLPRRIAANTVAARERMKTERARTNGPRSSDKRK